MSFRVYLVIAIIIGGLVFLTAAAFGDGIINWTHTQQARANVAGQSALGTIVMEPIRFVMSEPLWGPVVAAVFWPAVPLWLLGVPLVLVIVAGIDVAADVDQIRWG